MTVGSVQGKFEVPPEVAKLEQWMVWRYENGNKIPYQWNGALGKSNDPNAWCDLETAELHVADYSGLAFVFTESDGLCGVDLDKCYENGTWTPWAEEILSRFKGVAYGEFSPSGTGCKLTTWASKPEGSRCQNNKGVECYDTARFWTWTQECLGDGYREIGDGQEAIDWLLETHLAGTRGETGKKRLESSGSSSFDLLHRGEAYVLGCKPVAKGSLRNTAFSISGHLHALVGHNDERLSDTEVYTLLQRWNMRNTDQLREDELREAAVNGRKNGTPPADKPPEEPMHVNLDGILSEPESVTTTFDLNEDDHDSQTFTLVSANDFPWNAVPTDGIIGQIIEYNLSTSHKPQKELAFAGSLALMSAITGRKVEDEAGTRTNLYVLALGESGCGKEQARFINKKLLREIGADELVGPERIGSSAGLSAAVSDRLACLFQLDEIGHLLATMKNPGKATHIYNIAAVLMQMYSSANSLWVGDAYADSKKTPQIDQPHAVLYGTTTPDKFWLNLSADNISDGLLGRMMVFEAPRRVAWQESIRRPPPDPLRKSLRWWWDFQPGGIDWSKPAPIQACQTPDASARLREHFLDMDIRGESNRGECAPLWSRTIEKTAKLALILACSRQQSPDIEVNLDDADRAIQISTWLTERMIGQTQDYVASNLTEEQKKKVLRLVGRNKISQNELTRKTQWLKARERSELIQDLLVCGLLKCDEVKTGKRRRTVFWRP